MDSKHSRFDLCNALLYLIHFFSIPESYNINAHRDVVPFFSIEALPLYLGKGETIMSKSPQNLAGYTQFPVAHCDLSFLCSHDLCMLALKSPYIHTYMLSRLHNNFDFVPKQTNLTREQYDHVKTPCFWNSSACNSTTEEFQGKRVKIFQYLIFFPQVPHY